MLFQIYATLSRNSNGIFALSAALGAWPPETVWVGHHTCTSDKPAAHYAILKYIVAYSPPWGYGIYSLKESVGSQLRN